MENLDGFRNGLPASSKEPIAPSIITRDLLSPRRRQLPSSSPPVMPAKASMLAVVDAPLGSPPPSSSTDDRAAKSDSEAETVVLPGINGYSPSKRKKTIKHEDQQSEEGEIREDEETGADSKGDGVLVVPSSPNNNSTLGKRKRAKQQQQRQQQLEGDTKDDQQQHSFIHQSTRLNSVPLPSATSQSRPPSVKNRSDHSTSPSSTLTPLKAKSVDRLFPKNDSSSADEKKSGSHKRQYSVDGSEASSYHRQGTNKPIQSQSNSSEQTRKHFRSESPPAHAHRRISSVTTTSSSINGLSHKKKRVPAPLQATRDRQSTEYQSDESSASGSPHPRSSRLRKLTTPATAESTPSALIPSGKMGKKGRDGIGRTPLARACASDEGFNTVKQILEHSLEDLNVADNAGNTPLQIACLGGYADIVRLLIESGCDIHCMNVDRDTPLLDAVENGHLDVVRILIEAGVNPRRGNLEGEEPLDRLATDMDNCDDIKELLVSARLKCADRRPSVDQSTHEIDYPSSRGTSPRPSPTMQPSEDLYGGRRRRANGRSQKTNDKLLWQPMDTTTLRDAAGKGDTETVNRILQVRDNMADTESLVRAARGGHEDVMQLLLAIGGANADPPPLPPKSSDPEYATPMLAAIGRENIEVVKLLLDQPNFDPTKKFRGETYFEMAKRREGPRWREEEGILRDAYNKYAGESKEFPSRTRSPEARRDVNRSNKRKLDRIDNSTVSVRKHIEALVVTKPKSRTSSSGNDGAKHDSQKASPTADSHSKFGSSAKKVSKHKDEVVQSSQSTDREPPSNGHFRPKLVKKRPEQDPAPSTSDDDHVKPRRKLMSGKELKGEKEKQRRESAASTTSHPQVKEKPGSKLGDPVKLESGKSTNATRDTEVGLLEKLTIMDRPKVLKRDDSKDRLGAIRGDSPAKRPRESPTPPRAGSHDSTRTMEDGGLPAKKRRLDSDGQTSSSPDNRTNPSLLSFDHSRPKPNMLSKERHKQGSLASQEHGKLPEGHSEVKKASHQNKRLTNASSNSDGTRNGEKIPSHGDPRSQREAINIRGIGKGAERKVNEERDAKPKAEREDRNRPETEKPDVDRRRPVAEKTEAEERTRVIRPEESDRNRHHVEEDRGQLYLEQETTKKDEVERRRAAREAELRAERERHETERRAKLPRLLQLFEMMCSNPQTPQFASLFKEMIGVRHDTLRPQCVPSGAEAKELWILNVQVALLLGFKDLQLSRYTAWERVPASNIAKIAIYNLEGDRYACTTPGLRPFNPIGHSGLEKTVELRNENLRLFMTLDLFFVKLSDFMRIVSSFPHLRDIKMSVSHKELPREDGSAWQRWKGEAGAGPFCPRSSYYLNGQRIAEDGPEFAQLSPTPFPRPTPMAPRDPENLIGRLGTHSPRYAEACRAQGLWHLLPTAERPVAPSDLAEPDDGRGGSAVPATGSRISVAPSLFASPTDRPHHGKVRPKHGASGESGAGPLRLVNGVNGDEGHGPR